MTDTPYKTEASVRPGRGLRPRLFDIVGVFFAFHLLIGGGSLLGDPGIGWHLRAGQLIAESGAPDRDPFVLSSRSDQLTEQSHEEICKAALTETGSAQSAKSSKWIHDQWLSDLIFWQLYSVDNGRLLHVFAAMVLLLAYAGVIASLLKDEEPRRGGIAAPIAEAALLLLLGVNGSVQWFIRPMIFSFLFCGVLLLILRRELYGWPSTRLWTMPFLFALWVNLHGGFIIGLGLIGIAFLSALIEKKGAERSFILRRLGCAGLGCAAATLVNPWGAGIHYNLLGLLGSKFFMTLNMEWLPPDFGAKLFVPFLAAGLLLAGGFAMGVVGRTSLFDSLCAIGALIIALTQRRYVPFFAIFAAVPLLRTIEAAGPWFARYRPIGAAAQSIGRKEQFSPRLRYTFVAWGILSLVVAGRFAGDETRYDIAARFPKQAVDVLLAQAQQGDRVFHTPDWGGYLIFRAWPKVLPFIDDRNQLLGEGPYLDFFKIAGAQIHPMKLLDSYGFRWLLLQPEMPLREFVDVDQHWERIATGSEDAILFKRRCP